MTLLAFKVHINFLKTEQYRKPQWSEESCYKNLQFIIRYNPLVSECSHTSALSKWRPDRAAILKRKKWEEGNQRREDNYTSHKQLT